VGGVGIWSFDFIRAKYYSSCLTDLTLDPTLWCSIWSHFAVRTPIWPFWPDTGIFGPPEFSLGVNVDVDALMADKL
jgi:hypothetical protein